MAKKHVVASSAPGRERPVGQAGPHRPQGFSAGADPAEVSRRPGPAGPPLRTPPTRPSAVRTADSGSWRPARMRRRRVRRGRSTAPPGPASPRRPAPSRRPASPVVTPLAARTGDRGADLPRVGPARSRTATPPGDPPEAVGRFARRTEEVSAIHPTAPGSPSPRRPVPRRPRSPVPRSATGSPTSGSPSSATSGSPSSARTRPVAVGPRNRAPLPVRPGGPARRDREYRREGASVPGVRAADEPPLDPGPRATAVDFERRNGSRSRPRRLRARRRRLLCFYARAGGPALCGRIFRTRCSGRDRAGRAGAAMSEPTDRRRDAQVAARTAAPDAAAGTVPQFAPSARIKLRIYPSFPA